MYKFVTQRGTKHRKLRKFDNLHTYSTFHLLLGPNLEMTHKKKTTHVWMDNKYGVTVTKIGICLKSLPFCYASINIPSFPFFTQRAFYNACRFQQAQRRNGHKTGNVLPACFVRTCMRQQHMYAGVFAFRHWMTQVSCCNASGGLPEFIVSLTGDECLCTGNQRQRFSWALVTTQRKHLEPLSTDAIVFAFLSDRTEAKRTTEKQVRLVSVEAERRNHPSRRGGGSASQGGSASGKGGSSTTMTTTHMWLH